VQNIEKILEVPGVDAVFIGPNDLSVSLGIPEEYTHPRHVKEVEHVVNTAQARGIPAGPHCFNEEQLLIWPGKGARFVHFSADVRAPSDGYRPALENVRGAARH
jgi:4-hydroxy-2-oxoheptanedioate aldolase